MGERKLKAKRYALVFAMLFLASMIIHLVINNSECYYDASSYWEVGKVCGWDVRNIEWGFRGYLLPYIFSMCFKFGNMFGKEFLGYQLFSSFMFAFTFTFIFSVIVKIFEIEMDDKKIAYMGAICGGIFFLFFRGLFIYTLSDFYAFSFSMLSVVLMYFIIEYKQKYYVKAVEAFVLGICLYGTYNIRTIYLFSAIACVCTLIVWQLLQKKWIQLTVTIPECLIGMLVSAMPQIILNHKLFGEYSWKVPTEGLMLFQLYTGIGTGRYATFVGDSVQYGAAGMYFVDNIGQAILQKEQIAEFTSYGQLIKLIIHYPLDFLGIYARHLLNMLYPIYPNQYIQDITRDKTLLLVLFYTILFVSVFYIVNCIKMKSSKWVWLFLIMLPCVCILPGAVEIRFFIALHLMIYICAVFGIKPFIHQFKAHKVQFIACYLTGFVLYIAYAGTLLAATTEGIAIINNI